MCITPVSFSNGLARLPRNFFWGSLIPLPPFGGGRDAIQPASRGSLVVQCWPNYKVANRLVWLGIVLPSEYLQRHAHLPNNKSEKEKNGNRYPSRATYSSSLFRDIFHWKEVNKCRMTVPL